MENADHIWFPLLVTTVSVPRHVADAGQALPRQWMHVVIKTKFNKRTDRCMKHPQMYIRLLVPDRNPELDKLHVVEHQYSAGGPG